MRSAFTRAASALALAALAAGCFDEPTPAYRTVPPETRVYLSDRGLKDLSSCADALKAGPAIDYVNLDRNELETFPSELAGLTGLKWLRLNDNRLSSLPDLSALKVLRRIYLRGNRFESVPETLKDLPSLTDVDLSFNPIAEVPQWLAEKEGLVGLSFNGARLSRLPEDLRAWRSLKQLQLGEMSFSREEMTRIRQALPDTAIVF